MRMLLGLADGRLELRDLEYGDTLAELSRPRPAPQTRRRVGAITTLTWDVERDLALSGACDCSLAVWHVGSGEVVNQLFGHLAPVNVVAADFDREVCAGGLGGAADSGRERESAPARALPEGPFSQAYPGSLGKLREFIEQVYRWGGVREQPNIGSEAARDRQNRLRREIRRRWRSLSPKSEP